MSSDFPMFALSEEHQAVREAVRAICDAKVAPYAADVDENARYPQEAADALLAADFHAPHVPEEYGGAGADALDDRDRDRGGRPGLREQQPDPGGQQARLPAGPARRLGGAEEALPRRALAAGEGGFSYCLSEPDAGSDAAGMKTRAVSATATTTFSTA